MKIEKINDNQIKCTLNKSDLASRQIKISELAYGTEKAKGLFKDMMQQASAEFGFEAEDIPLMIEAIPVSTDCIVLIITKVDDPEELDTRFSKFAPSEEDDDFTDLDDDPSSQEFVGADEVVDLFKNLSEIANSASKDNKASSLQNILSESGLSSSIPKASNGVKNPLEPDSIIKVDLTKIYRFSDLNCIINASRIATSQYSGKNSLYKNLKNSHYYLVVTLSDQSPEGFNRVCNILSEYGVPERATYSSESFYKEHYKPILKDNAMQQLSLL